MCRPSLQNNAWKSVCNFVRYLEKIGDIRLDIIFLHRHRLEYNINSTSMCDPSGEKSKWWQVRKTLVAAGTLRLSAWPSFNSWSVSSRRGPSAQMGPGHHQKSKVKQLDTFTPAGRLKNGGWFYQTCSATPGTSWRYAHNTPFLQIQPGAITKNWTSLSWLKF